MINGHGFLKEGSGQKTQGKARALSIFPFNTQIH